MIEVDLLWKLNLAIFVPGGVLLTVATRRPSASLVGLVALSALVEVAQGLFGLGAPDPGDLLANSLGALLGAALGAVILRSRSGGWSPRSVTVSMIAVVAFAGSVWIGLTLGANARLDSLTAEVSLAFTGTTSADIAAGLTEAGSSSLFSRVPTRPDYIGQVGDTEEYGARYSTQFLGFYRCVFVRWDPSGMSLTSGSGTVCTEFRDRP